METKMENFTTVKQPIQSYFEEVQPPNAFIQELDKILTTKGTLSSFNIQNNIFGGIVSKGGNHGNKNEKFHNYEKTLIQSYFEEIQLSNVSMQEKDKIPIIKGTLSCFNIHNNILGGIVSKGGNHGNKNGKFHNYEKTLIQSYFEEIQLSNISMQEQDKIPIIKGETVQFQYTQ